MGNTQYEEILQRFGQWLKLRRGNSDSTIGNAKQYISHFLRWLEENGVQLGKINQEVVDDYLLYCNNKYARNTLVPITINLRKFCCFLNKDIDVKVAHVKAPNRDKTALTKEEVKKMFKAVEDNPLESAIIKTLYYTGMRISELINLNVDDVDFDRLQITIKHGKGDRYRVVNITRDCAMAIQRWLQVRPKPKEGHEKALFISCYRQRISDFYLWNLVKRTAAKAGITKKVYPHKFRITMITHMAEVGLSPVEIQAQSGHRDIGTLIGYIQHSTERIRKSYERVFEDGGIEDNVPDERVNIRPELSNEYYKKIVMQKYLDGEIDIDTLHSLLSTLEKKESERKPPIDPSYL